MDDRTIVITSIFLLVLLVVLAFNYHKITGNVVSDSICQPYSRLSFQAFNDDENPYGRVSVATADINLDGYKDIVVGAGEKSKSKVRVYSVVGKKLFEFSAFNDKENPGGEVYVSAGDIDGDKIDDIVVGSGAFGGSVVRIFDHDGDLLNQIKAFEDIENPYGIVKVYVANLDLDDYNEIIVGSGENGGSRIRVFDYKGSLIREFKAFSSQNPGGEVYVSAGDIIGDDKKEIIVGSGKGGTAKIAVFDYKGNKIKEFDALSSRNNGVFVAAGDLVFGDKDEIIAGSGERSNVIYVYNERGRAIYNMRPFGDNNPGGGIFVTSNNLLGNKKDEIIAGTGKSGTSYVNIIEVKCGIDPDCIDKDNDGACHEDDCLDINQFIYPGAIELCDKLDNDCDLLIDEACNECIPFKEICNDNEDNDCDGKVDCNDSDCSAIAGCY